jgi:hypothetical protein
MVGAYSGFGLRAGRLSCVNVLVNRPNTYNEDPALMTSQIAHWAHASESGEASEVSQLA